MNNSSQIAGYAFGADRVYPSPVSLIELKNLEAAVGWSEADAESLRLAGEILLPQAEEMVDYWRTQIARQPQLSASFLAPDGNPDEHYKAAVKRRFVQWISDLCLRPYDQDWLNYQNEIGLRHTPEKKNTTDGAHTPPVVPLRYLIGFAAVVVTSVDNFLAKPSHPSHELQKMRDAWARAVLLSVALWSRPYTTAGWW
jgi:hypothetical protein